MYHELTSCFPADVCQPAIANNIVWTCLAFNIITDLYLLAIPLPMLWQSTLRPVKKAGLMIVFSGGLLVMMCAIMRVHFILSDSNDQHARRVPLSQDLAQARVWQPAHFVAI
jgi:hypothetical protein